MNRYVPITFKHLEEGVEEEFSEFEGIYMFDAEGSQVAGYEEATEDTEGGTYLIKDSSLTPEEKDIVCDAIQFLLDERKSIDE
jgi:hypothetical protein